ncbi:hypothetical protein GQ457_08G002970 [Hibiscus cannabinus]
MKRSRETKQDFAAVPVFDGASGDGIIRWTRDLRPSDFVLKIESYSVLCESGAETYESGIFDAGGYKWNLCFYPNGNRRVSEGNDHVSLYLKIADAASLPLGWEVNAKFTFLMFDQHRDKFFTVEGKFNFSYLFGNLCTDVSNMPMINGTCKFYADCNVRRFHETKTEWGVPRLLSLDVFKDVSNGYLVDDCCIIGAEVFVIKHTSKMECFSMVKPLNNIYTWRIENFSALHKSKARKYSEECKLVKLTYFDPEFRKLLVYLKQDSITKDEVLAAFLCLFDNGSLTPNQKVYAEYKLRVKNQLDIKKNKEYTVFNVLISVVSNTTRFSQMYESAGKSWFGAPPTNFGWRNMISSKDLTDVSKGFVLDDRLILEGEVVVMSVTKSFS